MSTVRIIKYVAGSFGTNIYLVYDEDTKDCFIVDPGAKCDRLMHDMYEYDLFPSHIILTHGHGDHTDGLPFIKSEFTNCKLVACKKEKHFLYDRDMSRGSGGIIADQWVQDNDSLDIGSLHLKFIETPGHTPGSMCILLGNVLFAGDTLFFGSVGRTDLPGGDEELIIKSIKEKLFILPDETIVYPGHMKETSIGFEKRFNPFV